MSGQEDRLRIDVWLWRARFAKTRAAAARLVGEGGVRLLRDGLTRRLDKPSVLVGAGDQVLWPGPKGLCGVRILRLPARRGPPAEARATYEDLEANLAAGLDGLA